MEQTVYGDILFFVNFCMDFQCLFLTAKLMRRPFGVWRSVAAAVLGALYACVALFLSTAGLWAFLADCGVCLMMCVLAFYGADAGVRRVGIAFLIYFGVSFAVGGVMSGIASLLSHIEMPVGAAGQGVSSPMFFLLALFGGGATLLWGRFCQRRAKGKRAELTLSLGEQRLTVRCMVDTANLLRDPVSGRPVVLIDSAVAASLLPEPLLTAAAKGDCSALTHLPTELVRRVRLIPAKTATGGGMLFALTPDSAMLNAGRGAAAVELLIAPVPLAVERDDYAALLPAELIVD
ncbi:MAG: sigma-E processing peptidase SpoIIGA [Clostridia bacterium]|nr:sigma-E processing peptidase SpoIIGA [Clostridia bacterium]